jgi:anti-sigma B factor antagonist
MELKTHTSGNAVTLELDGRFDTYTAQPVADWLAQTTVAGSTRIVVDLARVSFVDSTGLAVLVKGMKQCRQRGGDLYLCGLQRPVRMIFELTRLDKAFEIFGSHPEAIAAFTGEQ